MGKGTYLGWGGGTEDFTWNQGLEVGDWWAYYKPPLTLVYADLYPPKTHCYTKHPLWLKLQTDREYSMILVQQIRLPLPTNTREAKGYEGGGGEPRFAIALQFSSWPEPIQAPGIYPINFCSVDQRERGYLGCSSAKRRARTTLRGGFAQLLACCAIRYRL